MFDIGFFELLVIAIVGLLVIGPEQLPGTLRTLALWWGRFKRGIQNTRSEFEQQIGADDIRRQLHNEDVMQRLQATEQEIRHTLSEGAADVQEGVALATKLAKDAGQMVDSSLEPVQNSLEPKISSPEPKINGPESLGTSAKQPSTLSDKN